VFRYSRALWRVFRLAAIIAPDPEKIKGKKEAGDGEAASGR